MGTKCRIIDRVCFVSLVVVSILGFMAYSFVASGVVRKDIEHAINFVSRGDPLALPAKRIYHHSTIGHVKIVDFFAWSPDGVFNYVHDGETHMEVFRRSRRLAFGGQADLLGWGVRYPFLVPLCVHLFCAWALPAGIGLARSRSVDVVISRSFAQRALISALYTVAIVLFLQLGRMFWASHALPICYWDTLMISGLGSVTYFVYSSLVVPMYFLCILGTAKLQLKQRAGQENCRCLGCGYQIHKNQNCPECGLETDGDGVPSKLAVGPLGWAIIMTLAFGLPFFVERVYSVMNIR